MTVLGCIVDEHNIWLVLLAVLLCGAGSWVTTHLFHRTTMTSGRPRIGWHVMTALVAGVAIWCTHFVAMLGYDVGVPVGFDPVLTITSLLVAVIGSTAGFALAGSKLSRSMPAIGGAVVGLAIAAMHYTGMMAYRVQGIISWDKPHLVASIVLSVILSATALHFGVRKGETYGRSIMASSLALAILALHFTGMAAFNVEPMVIEGAFSNPEALSALAISISGMAFVIVISGLVSYLIDDSSRAETVEHLRRMALNDTLTGLPNRASFNERIDHEIELADARRGKLAMIGIDLNRFKEINDTRGHKAGDEVLAVLGHRLRGLLREEEGEFVARVGGDEFAALFRIDEGDKADSSSFLGRLETAMFKPIHLENFEITAGGSFGVAIYPDDATDKETLVSNADIAMYRAKAEPSKKICFYEGRLDASIKERRGMATDLREALARDQLSIHYQVQMSVSTREIRGYEALLRWNHPEHGFIPPSEFIPIAEENGLIMQLGEWVLRSACQAATTWDPPYKVAVNVSAVQFADSDLPKLITEVLRDTGLTPDRLELELTETAIFKDPDRAQHMLRQIKSLGVPIALDDFGTGYSSFSTLRSFPFSKIKLDRSFINEAMSNSEAIAIIRAVLALGRGLGIPVLAEGIETNDQLTLLGAEGCDEAQGYLVGSPASLDQMVTAGQITILKPTDLPQQRRPASGQQNAIKPMFNNSRPGWVM